jgi:hypothetical protein
VETGPKFIFLRENDIAGPLPDDLFQLTLLERLFLNFNSFTGSLPALIGQLTRLSDRSIRAGAPIQNQSDLPRREQFIWRNSECAELPPVILEVLSLQQETRSLTDEVERPRIPVFLVISPSSIGSRSPASFISGRTVSGVQFLVHSSWEWRQRSRPFLWIWPSIAYTRLSRKH